MQLPNLLTLGALVVLGIAIVWIGHLWSRSSARGDLESISSDFLIGLGRGLGLERYTERDYFGERIQVLSGTFRKLSVELEISSGNWRPYARVVVEFPRSIAQDINVFSQNRNNVLNYVREVQLLEVGDPEFDGSFHCYAPDAEVLTRVLSEATRYQMLRVLREVDELRLTDESLFLFADHSLDGEEVKRVLKKSLDLGDRIFSTAERLGPRSPEKSAAHYERATVETTARTSSSSKSKKDRPTTYS